MDEIIYCEDCAYLGESNLDDDSPFCTLHGYPKPSYLYGCGNGKKKKVTNADRIRRMSDEELLELFTDSTEDGERFFCCPSCRTKTESECFAFNCGDCFLEWLQEEEK